MIKFAYNEPVGYGSEKLGEAVLTALGWKPASFRWIAGGGGMARSYHCEVKAPENLELIDGMLSAVTTDGKTRTDKSETLGERIHLHLTNVPSDANWVLRTDLRAIRRGLPRNAAALGAAVSATLTAGVVFHHNVARASDTAAVLLVAIPALIGAFLARPGEHLLATRILFGIRTLTATIGALAFIAAASMTVSADRAHTILVTWIPLAALSWLATFALTLSAFLPRVRE